MPNLSGIEVCRRLKSRPDTRSIPIIMLSARTEEVDKVRGLETGADDYVVKPYSVVELMARVRTQLRRVRPSTVGLRTEFDDIILDSETHKVSRDNKPLKLGPTEFRLLSTFMEKPGRVWSREQLLDRVWGRDIYVDTRTVDVHIGRLRKALTQYGGTDQYEPSEARDTPWDNHILRIWRQRRLNFDRSRICGWRPVAVVGIRIIGIMVISGHL